MSDSDSDWSASLSADSDSRYDSDDNSNSDVCAALTAHDGVASNRDLASDAVASSSLTQQQHQRYQTSLLLSPSSPSQPLRQRRARRASHYASATTNEAIAAYSEALRTTANHRESISTSDASGTQFLLPEETRRRHRESKKRVEVAERAQQQLLQAHELNAVTEDMPLWLHACVIPPRWRQQMVAHLTPIHAQMAFCQSHLLRAWRLLLPPFDHANLLEFEARAALFERSIALLEAALVRCQQLAIDGEKTAACGFIQFWYRKQLAKRGFYTRSVRMSRRDRGLIPGLFDSTPDRSTLTIDRKQKRMTLEFPVAAASPRESPRPAAP